MKTINKIVLSITTATLLATSTFAACGADVAMGNHTISGLANGVNDTDAVNVVQTLKETHLDITSQDGIEIKEFNLVHKAGRCFLSFDAKNTSGDTISGWPILFTLNNVTFDSEEHGSFIEIGSGQSHMVYNIYDKDSDEYRVKFAIQGDDKWQDDKTITGQFSFSCTLK